MVSSAKMNAWMKADEKVEGLPDRIGRPHDVRREQTRSARP
jgi:hypothetical protein